MAECKHPPAICSKAAIGTAIGCNSQRVLFACQVKRALKGKAQCETVWGHTLYHPEDVPYKLDMSDLPDTFTPARHKVCYTDLTKHVPPASQV